MDPNAACDPDSGIFGLDTPAEAADLHLIPVPWDATTSYRPGTRRGPAAIVRASHQLDMYDRALGVSYIESIAMLDADPELEALGDEARAHAEVVIAAAGRRTPATIPHMEAVNRASARVNAQVRARAEASLDAGKIVGIVGGEHSVPFGAIAALAERHPGLGILHVDAHADLRREYEGFEHSHASIMDNVLRACEGVGRLVQVGIRDFCEEEADRIAGSGGRVITFFDRDLADRSFAGETWAATVSAILAPLPERVYVSFDIDGLAPELCPHTGTPVPGGLTYNQAIALIVALGRSGRTIVGFDLCEVAPSAADPDDEWDANVGARILYQLCGWTLRSQGRI
ncbi:MAG: agmatinase family protein [Myxococcales bacterium]|nr:agmatinase family protein [Myxococcales bacterium]